MPPGCITTSDELTKVFLTKFLPPSKITSPRNQITTFSQKEDKALYEAWEQFKDLLQLCLHCGLQRWRIMQTFSNGVTQSLRSNIDAVVRGTRMSKIKNEAYNLIEEMTLNNF